VNSSARCKKLGGLLASAILLAATHLTRFSRHQQAVVTRRSDRLVMLVFEARPVLMVPPRLGTLRVLGNCCVPTSPRCF